MAFAVAYYAVKGLRQDWTNKNAAERGVSEAYKKIHEKAAQEHPDKPVSKALGEAASSLSQADLSSKTGAAKADTAAGQFLGYYLVNVRTRAEYCRNLGVDISPFVAAFRNHNAGLYAKTREIHSRETTISPDDLEETLYSAMKPTIERLLQDATAAVATENGITTTEVCEAFATEPALMVKELDLAKTNPTLRNALLEAQ